MGRWLDRLANRPVDVTVRHDQARRAVTNQSGHEQTESQIRPRPLSMDGDRFRNGNGFPRWVANDCNHQFLKMDSRTLVRWARLGYVPAHPMGEGKRKLWRFLEHELLEWLEARKPDKKKPMASTIEIAISAHARRSA